MTSLPLLFSGLQLAMKLSLAKYQITKIQSSIIATKNEAEFLSENSIIFYWDKKAMKYDYFPKFLLHILATKK